MNPSEIELVFPETEYPYRYCRTMARCKKCGKPLYFLGAPIVHAICPTHGTDWEEPRKSFLRRLIG